MKKKPENNHPKKVFIPRYTAEESFPKESGIYFIDNPAVRYVAYYEKGLGFVKNQWSKHHKVDVQWWLEEKDLPSDDEIKIVAQSLSSMTASQFNFSAGVKWLRKDLLTETK